MWHWNQVGFRIKADSGGRHVDKHRASFDPTRTSDRWTPAENRFVPRYP
jgi:hypothetical protein